MGSMHTNLTNNQQDYSIFLPAISTFYSSYVGKQRFSNHIDPSRIPTSFTHGVESLNFLDDKKGQFYYKWGLYSAGHADLDVNVFSAKEDMVRNRDRSTSMLVGDSGGFQIAKTRWPADWKDPNCPKAAKKRMQVLSWMDAYMDYGMILDIPAWVINSAQGREASGVTTYLEAVTATEINNDYFIKHRNGNCKFLNVLQGETHAEADDWYSRMKKYCDPRQYSNHFNGWAMGGQNKCDVHLVLRRLVEIIHDGLLEPGIHDWMHFLGASKLEWAVLLTDIQRAIRKNYNPNFTISFDCASPFLATANGLVYTEYSIEPRKNWTYRMLASVDDKKYASDTRLFKDVVLQDGHFDRFMTSPVIDQVPIKDVCIYGPTDLNKIGKIGKTSWDSFTYAILMGHNVWLHAESVQEANRRYDAGTVPHMLIDDSIHVLSFRSLIEDVFATSDKGAALALINKHNKFWTRIVGTVGTTGKNVINAKSMAMKNFEIEVAPTDKVKPATKTKTSYNFDQLFSTDTCSR